jgi:hypothetical protein
LAGRGSREVRELTLDRFLPKIGPGAVSSGAGGVEALDRPPLLLLLGAGASWRQLGRAEGGARKGEEQLGGGGLAREAGLCGGVS